MATAPVKSQPLHNFSLPYLKWGHKSHQSASSNHRFRRRDSPSPELHHHHHQHHSDGGESEENVTTTTKLQTGPRTARNHHHRFSFSPCSTKQQKPQENENAVVSHRDHTEDKEPLWNLRPRKHVNFGSETLPFEEPERVERNTKNNESRSLRLRGGYGEGNGPSSSSGSGLGLLGPERKTVEKRKLWISLSREEIEEDVYALTGSRPSRRPKKRPKTVQKQLDSVFPGLYMVGATVDLFRVHDTLEALEVGKLVICYMSMTQMKVKVVTVYKALLS